MKDLRQLRGGQHLVADLLPFNQHQLPHRPGHDSTATGGSRGNHQDITGGGPGAGGASSGAIAACHGESERAIPLSHDLFVPRIEMIRTEFHPHCQADMAHGHCRRRLVPPRRPGRRAAAAPDRDPGGPILVVTAAAQSVQPLLRRDPPRRGPERVRRHRHRPVTPRRLARYDVVDPRRDAARRRRRSRCSPTGSTPAAT